MARFFVGRRRDGRDGEWTKYTERKSESYPIVAAAGKVRGKMGIVWTIYSEFGALDQAVDAAGGLRTMVGEKHVEFCVFEEDAVVWREKEQGAGSAVAIQGGAAIVIPMRGGRYRR